ncbi:transcription factor A, mitochondrial [Leptodactylus fuscus]|uniref:transcription factor A, mitochondrial n=1 Tax=Leptodactylus fuscus TaxID=238119 RepID=UPI003F4F08B2
MVSLLSRGVGLLAKSLAGLSCTQATRCSGLQGSLSAVHCISARWFSNQERELPKRPLSSYFRFVIEQRPALSKKYPEAKPAEIAKMLGLEWKGLSESSRKLYIEAANEEQLKYKDEIRKYKEKLSPLELELLKEQRKRRLVKRKRIRLSRELTILGKPKGARNAYNIFVSERFQEATAPSLSGKMNFLHGEWKKLSQSQKQMYMQLAVDDKIRYENEMKAWEEQMLEIGREDLLRLKSRKRLKVKPGMHITHPVNKPLKKTVKKVIKPARGHGKTDKWKNEE